MASISANAPATARSGSAHVFIVLAVVAITTVFFLPTLQNDFVAFDDDYNIYRNEHVGVVTWERIQWMFSDATYTRRYMPLGWLAVCGVVQWDGFHPAGFHLVNLALHGMNVGLLYIILTRLMTRLGAAFGDWRQTFLPAAAAVWWGINPLRVEVVAWSSGIFYGLATFWFLLAYLAYLRGRVGLTDCPYGWLGLSIVCYILSLLTYPAFIGGAAVVLATELYLKAERKADGYGPTPKLARLGSFSIFGWGLPACAAAVISWICAARAGAFWQPTIRLSWMERLLETPFFLAYYVVKPWIPIGLSPVYDTLAPPLHVSPWFVVSGGAMIVFGTILFLARRRVPTGLICGLIAWVGLLVPMCPLAQQVTSMSDRYAQVATMVLLAMAVAAVMRSSREWLAPALAAVLLVSAVAWAPLARKQIRYWQKTDLLVEQMSSVLTRPTSIRRAALARLIDYYHYYRGDPAAARAVWAQEHILGAEDVAALAQRKPPPPVLGGFVPAPALTLFRVACATDLPRGDIHTADARLAEALRWAPQFWLARAQYAMCEAALGRTTSAEAQSRIASQTPGYDPERFRPGAVDFESSSSPASP